jgi:cell division protein FtsL
LLIALLAAARLVLISKVAAAARDLQEMRRDLSGLQQENADLEVEIAGWRSVEGLLDRARELDLEHAEEIRFVEP